MSLPIDNIFFNQQTGLPMRNIDWVRKALGKDAVLAQQNDLLGSGISGVANGVLSLGNNFMESIQVPDTTSYEHRIDDINDWRSSAVTSRGLQREMEQLGANDPSISYESIGGASNADIANNVISGIGTGASAGATFGPVGAVVGGVVGALSSGISSAIGRNKTQDKVHELNRELDLARQSRAASVKGTADNINYNTSMDWIKNNNAPKLGVGYNAGIGNGNFKAIGGSLDQPSSGFTTFNEGGTHQQNPYGGVMQGIARDGQPNFVEEGETKYNNYIFSNRIKASKSMLKKHNVFEEGGALDNASGKSYAELSKQIAKESGYEDAPTDPIAIETFNNMIDRLMNAEEEQKFLAEQRKMANMIDKLPDEQKAMLAEQMMTQQPQIGVSGGAGLQYRCGGRKYQGAGQIDTSANFRNYPVATPQFMGADATAYAVPTDSRSLMENAVRADASRPRPVVRQTTQPVRTEEEIEEATRAIQRHQTAQQVQENIDALGELPVINAASYMFPPTGVVRVANDLGQYAGENNWGGFGATAGLAMFPLLNQTKGPVHFVKRFGQRAAYPMKLSKAKNEYEKAVEAYMNTYDADVAKVLSNASDKYYDLMYKSYRELNKVDNQIIDLDKRIAQAESKLQRHKDFNAKYPNDKIRKYSDEDISKLESEIESMKAQRTDLQADFDKRSNAIVDEEDTGEGLFRFMGNRVADFFQPVGMIETFPKKVVKTRKGVSKRHNPTAVEQPTATPTTPTSEQSTGGKGKRFAKKAGKTLFWTNVIGLPTYYGTRALVNRNELNSQYVDETADTTVNTATTTTTNQPDNTSTTSQVPVNPTPATNAQSMYGRGQKVNWAFHSNGGHLFQPGGPKGTMSNYTDFTEESVPVYGNGRIVDYDMPLYPSVQVPMAIPQEWADAGDAFQRGYDMLFPQDNERVRLTPAEAASVAKPVIYRENSPLVPPVQTQPTVNPYPWESGFLYNNNIATPTPQGVKGMPVPESVDTMDNDDAKTNASDDGNDNTNHRTFLDWMSRFGNNSGNRYHTGFRYAPAWQSGINAVTDILGVTNQPDYSNAEIVENSVQRPNMIGYTPTFQPLQYRPIDTTQFMAAMLREGAANRSAVLDNANANSATANAQLSSLNRSSQEAIGNLGLQVDAQNAAQRNAVATANNAGRQADAERAMKIEDANQRLNWDYFTKRADSLLSGASLRESIAQSAANARAANMDRFTSNLGSIGHEDWMAKALANNPYFLYAPDIRTALTKFTGQQNGVLAAKGGRIGLSKKVGL